MNRKLAMVYFLVPATMALLNYALWGFCANILGELATPNLILMPLWNMEPVYTIPRTWDCAAVFILGIAALSPLLLRRTRYTAYRERLVRERWETCVEIGFVAGCLIGITAFDEIKKGVYDGREIHEYGSLVAYALTALYLFQKHLPRTANHTDSFWKTTYAHAVPFVLGSLPGICFLGGTNMLFIWAIACSTSFVIFLPASILINFVLRRTTQRI